MENDMAVLLRQLTEALKQQNELNQDFQAKLLEELRVLNTNLRHLQGAFAPRDY